MNNLYLKKHITVLMALLILFISTLPVYSHGSIDDLQKTVDEENFIDNSQGESDITQTSAARFRPGDGLFVNTFPDTLSFLNTVFSIDENGFVDFPIVGNINVSQMTDDEIKKFIRDNFKNYTRSPNIFIKPMLRVNVIGGFVRPGLYYADYNSSFWDLIRLAGGPVRETGIEEMEWERDGSRIESDLTMYVQNGVSLKTMGIQSGDLIWAPSPDAETAWDVVTRTILPILGFVTSIYVIWITYQQMVVITQTR